MPRSPSIGFVAFVRDVLRVKLTPAQHVLAAVAFDGVDPIALEGEERELARRIFGDLDVVDVHADVVAIVAGRRSGKTYVGSLRQVHLALTTPLYALAPGEAGYAMFLGPDLRLARQALKFARGAVKAIPRLAHLVGAATADAFSIRRPDGRVVTFEALPATRGGSAIRGRTCTGVLFDEAAFFRDQETGIVNDRDLLDAAIPGVVAGGQILIVSTPWAESGIVYEFFRDQWGSPKTALVARAATAIMRPSERKRVERERERDPDNAAREYDCQFIGAAAGAFISAQAIDRSVVRNFRRPLAPKPGLVCHAAVDLAFSENSSTITITRVERERAVLVHWEEVKPKPGLPLRPSVVIERFASIAAAHGCRTMHGDRHYLESVREHLEGTGVAFVPIEGGTEARVKLYQAGRAGIEEGRVILPDVPRLVSQLKEISAKPLPGGGWSIKHARRGSSHGDLAAAAIIAIALASRAIARRSDGSSRAWTNVAPSAALAAFGSGFGLPSRNGPQGDPLDRIDRLVDGGGRMLYVSQRRATPYTFSHDGNDRGGGF
jgi:hypothetical protein